MVVGRDLEEFRSFISQRLFKLRMYNVLEDGRQLFCVALTVRCEDPVGWIAVWLALLPASPGGSKASPERFVGSPLGSAHIINQHPHPRGITFQLGEGPLPRG